MLEAAVRNSDQDDEAEPRQPEQKHYRIIGR